MKKFSIIFTLLILFIITNSANATVIRTTLNEQTLEKGCTITSADNKLKIGVQPNSLSVRKKINVAVKKINSNEYSLKNETLVSSLYSFDLYNKDTVQVERPLWLKFRFANKNKDKGKKSIKYFNETSNKWMKISAKKVKNKKLMKGSINLPYAVVGVFNEKNKPKNKPKKQKKESNDYQVGYASWYDYHGAASTKYPYGSIVKVTNLANNKSCQVKIVDYGPFVKGRVIDLPRDSFAEIADLGAGVVEVKVELISQP